MQSPGYIIIIIIIIYDVTERLHGYVTGIRLRNRHPVMQPGNMCNRSV